MIDLTPEERDFVIECLLNGVSFTGTARQLAETLARVQEIVEKMRRQHTDSGHGDTDEVRGT